MKIPIKGFSVLAEDLTNPTTNVKEKIGLNKPSYQTAKRRRFDQGSIVTTSQDTFSDDKNERITIDNRLIHSDATEYLREFVNIKTIVDKSTLSKSALLLLDLIKYEARYKTVYKEACNNRLHKMFYLTTMFYFSYDFYCSLIDKINKSISLSCPNTNTHLEKAKKQNFSRALQELIQNNFIWKANINKRGWYNYNWNYFFTDDREKLAKQYREVYGRYSLNEENPPPIDDENTQLAYVILSRD